MENNNKNTRPVKSNNIKLNKPLNRKAGRRHNDEALRRILLLISVAVFLIGIALVLNRNSNSNKYIGTVFVMSGEQSEELDGFKIQKQYKDEIKDYDPLPLSDIIKLDNIPSFVQNENTAVSFTGNYICDVFYSVYDMNFEPVYTDKTSLSIPTKNKDGYIITIDVKWGRSKNNATLRYYFTVKQ